METFFLDLISFYVFRRLVRPSAGSDASPSVGRSSSSAREEERRKVLEMEAAHARRGSHGGVVAGGGGAAVGRSTSRASRATAPAGGGRPVVVRSRPLSDERDSQYSGYSSSSAKPGGPGAVQQQRLARIKRSTSNATTAGVGPRFAPGGPRKKLPASLTSSLNSSESENAANGGQRSVFLHSACVADIPPNTVERRAAAQQQQQQPAGPPPQRAQSAESRDNLLGRPQQQQMGNGTGGSNLQKSKKISRSISLLTPWKARQQQRAAGQLQSGEIHYDNNNIYGQGGGMASSSAKPPRPPPPSQRQRIIIPTSTMQRDKKSASSTNLLRDEQGGGGTPHFVHQEVQEPMVIGEERRTVQRAPNKVSRSVSMPKDTRLAGWFKRKKRV